MFDPSQFSDAQIDAMQAIFDLCEQMDKELSIASLAQIIKVAVDPESATRLEVVASMLLQAIQLAFDDDGN